jgi:3-dehydroquinate synthase class II
VSEPYNKFEVLADCTNAITQEFSTPMQIGQAVSYTSVYTILNKIEGVSDVTNVKIKQKTGQQYASATMNLDVLTSIDGKKIVPPENVVFELKFPETDIIGSVI